MCAAHKEYGSITFEDYLRSFDTSQDLRLNFNKVIREICDSAHLDNRSRDILLMLLVEGYKTKEVAEAMEISPAAVSQRYNNLKEHYLEPYFKNNFDMDFDMPVVMMPELGFGAQFSYELPMESLQECFSLKREALSEQSISRYSMEKKRTTPSYINELAPGEIFVFGSNLRGIHAGGAARIAHDKFGAIMGQGVGLQGQSYAIPTMQGGVETIKPYVDEFIAFAREHRELTFLVTRIGCGIAGFTDWQIAPLFADARHDDNIILPEGW